ncbi:hypothetical protein [Palleronia rufa]|uniref:hypothetical protein n=1 Tax=Palleronia rufa TaxID=1530186 RepID=UPI00056CED80|nr:hypothetical protein [Palleronia rufa]
MTSKWGAATLFALTLGACTGGATIDDGDTGVRRVGDTIVVEDVAGPTLIVDANGCQAIIPPGATAGEFVRDGAGNPVCTGSGFALLPQR